MTRRSLPRAGRAARLALLVLGAAASFARAAPLPAELVFVQGVIYTVDAARSQHSALAVSGGRIAYVGTDAGAAAYIGARSRVIDLHGRMLLPGFQDSHVHPAEAPNPATALDLHDAQSQAQLFARIRAYAKAHPRAPWIVGDGWDAALFLPSGRPTRQMLDALVADRPAYLTDDAGHSAWVNTRALRLARIDGSTPDPANGRIEHEGSGAPSGVLGEDAAMDLVATLVPAPSAAEVKANLAAALATMAAFGFTALVDADSTPPIEAAYQALAASDALPVRVRLCQAHSPAVDDEVQLQDFIARRARLAGAGLDANCVKLFLDGAYGSHTLALLAPYADAPGFGSGRLFIDPVRLARLVTRLDAAGFQVHMHAQGDGAVRAGLDAIEAAREHNGALGHRHTLAHLCLIDAADLNRFRRLGVVANMSPLWSRPDAWETELAPRLFGAERAAQLFRTRTLLDSGAVVAFGSDWPVTSVAPLAGIETALTHRYVGGSAPAGRSQQSLNPAERISLEQAIVAYTSAGAYLLGAETERGSLEAGKVADLTVLGANLFETAPADLHSVPVDLTVLGGRIIYERGAP